MTNVIPGDLVDVVRRDTRLRLVALNSSLGMNCALLVDRLDGLRHAADMRRDDEGREQRPSFAAIRWADAGGKVWQEIGLAELAGQQQFLGIAG